MSLTLNVAASPHLHTRRTVATCMWNVVIALLPALAASLYFFGIGAAIVITTAILGCVITEYAINRWMFGRPSTLLNGSAILTGLLLAFNLPSNLPIWIVLIGSVVAIGIGKMAFGGLGCNIWNPALVGRVFLLISFPAQMTTWPLPIVNRFNYVDATTGATPMSMINEGGQVSLNVIDGAVGAIGGSLGEVSAIALLIGFVYLLWTRTISWHIPVSIFATVAIFSLCIGANVGLELVSGGLFLGAIFMATDYVTSPMSHRGMMIYGVLIGLLTIIIRQWGSYPEGMSFAILLANSCVPLIDRYVKPRQFGERRKA